MTQNAATQNAAGNPSAGNPSSQNAAGEKIPPTDAGGRAPNGGRKKLVAAVVFIIVAVVGASAVFYYLKYKAVHITTDDAYVDGDIYAVSARVPGTVSRVLVQDNGFVKAGQPLIELDPADYEVRAKEAAAAHEAERARFLESAAKVETESRRMLEMKSALDAAKARREVKLAALAQSESDFKRSEILSRKELIAVEMHEKTVTARRVAAAEAAAASEDVRRAETAVNTQKSVIRLSETSRDAQRAVIAQKEAALEAARLNLGYTKVFSSADGYVNKRSVDVGSRVQAAQPLMAVVPLKNLWITANFKETQIEKIRPGRKAEIRVDTYPGRVYYGHVDSLMAGTGAAFSLFPAENATGHFVKVVQRIPVKIVIDNVQAARGVNGGATPRVNGGTPPRVGVPDGGSGDAARPDAADAPPELPPLRVGMSVVVTVLVQ
jgi:membrane fusion protein (multidrug efflux system)